MSAREWGPELHAGDEWEGDGMRVRIISVTPIGLARATLTCEPRDRIYGLTFDRGRLRGLLRAAQGPLT